MGLADDASPLSRRRSYRSGPSHHHAGSATLPVSKSKERQLPVFSLLFLVRSVVLEAEEHCIHDDFDQAISECPIGARGSPLDDRICGFNAPSSWLHLNLPPGASINYGLATSLGLHED